MWASTSMLLKQPSRVQLFCFWTGIHGQSSFWQLGTCNPEHVSWRASSQPCVEIRVCSYSRLHAWISRARLSTTEGSTYDTRTGPGSPQMRLYGLQWITHTPLQLTSQTDQQSCCRFLLSIIRLPESSYRYISLIYIQKISNYNTETIVFKL